MKRQLITGSKGHVFICGMTQSGKTYFAVRALEQVSQGVLFINIQNTKMPDRYITTYANQVDFEQIKSALKAGNKIDLRFPAAWRESQIMQVIGFLSKELIKAGFSEKNPVYIAYDECQAISRFPDALREVRMVATRGLYLGVWCVFITQRPALADLTLYTQSTEHYIFQLGKGERGYFKGKGIDYDECLKLWEANGKHSYIYTNGFIIEGRKAI